jgi:hypothetical protein
MAYLLVMAKRKGVSAAAWFYSTSFHSAPYQSSERFDYDRQAWVKDGRYVRCGHPENMDCGCFGRAHAGELAPAE